MKIGVIAGPLRETASAARGQEMTQDIAVGIEDADVRDRAGADLLLPARLPEKRLRREDRRRPIALVAEERRPFPLSSFLGSVILFRPAAVREHPIASAGP
jgi:hypothetical protein